MEFLGSELGRSTRLHFLAMKQSLKATDKMDVFGWLQHYVTHTRQPSVEYQTLMFVLLKYGVPVEQKARTRLVTQAASSSVFQMLRSSSYSYLAECRLCNYVWATGIYPFLSLMVWLHC